MVLGVYAASKAALRSFARTWANELKGCGIRVNAISPGTIDTPMIRSGVEADPEQGPQILDFLISRIPLGRIGVPDDVADVILFLASDQSRFVTGSELFVDGGTVQV
ncbi:SDR family oxidoreductase [Amycolatopsis sp. NPDC049253]|uniref:SDR family NAD(P)-dependent oxidoreductase n=1 Tax=Amycolatopsis sp. NPDC049253 TaxID=3155274 RepID=UPI00343AB540